MTATPETMATLRTLFKTVNKLVLLQWRLGLGWAMNLWPQGLGAYLVIVHTGRKTGLRRRTPVNYAQVDGEIYCTAGFGRESHWYRNITANPTVEIWLPDGRWQARAEDITGSGQVALLRQVLINSGFVAPLMGIYPHTMNDDDLLRVTADYRLIHLKRLSPADGANGPGDLKWLWLPLLLVGRMLLNRKRANPKTPTSAP